MTLEHAWNDLCATINSVNSVAASTFDCSSDPARISPAPLSRGIAYLANPEFCVDIQVLLPVL
jgi:hypothetical protein